MDKDSVFDVIIIGGGIVGLSAAYQIQLRYKDLKLLVLEKEDQLSLHQSGRNSGVIHSGLYYKPQSYRAKNCVAGRRELVKFCQNHKIAHDICGKIIVATDESELPFLDKIFNNGIANGTEGIEKINSEKIREIEPYCTNGIAGIWVPCTGIVDFPAVVKKLAELVREINPNSFILTNRKVLDIERNETFSRIVTNTEIYQGKHLIFCTGLFSDRTAQMDQVKTTTKIVGFRGDYYDLSESGLHKVRNLIYPVPNPDFPFLGVHFTRMIQGGVECGPNAVFTFKREGYNKTDFSFQDTWDALTFKGTWKLFYKNWQFGLSEYRRAFSKRRFLQSLQKLIPSLEIKDIKTGRTGVRAIALGIEGEITDDFVIQNSHNSIHVLNAPSPAATSGLAIGKAICEIAEKQFWNK